jgi:peptidoglycan/LPS O-acetylase OafA/YrhL
MPDRSQAPVSVPAGTAHQSDLIQCSSDCQKELRMDSLLSFSGILGAICCVGMYAAVSFGKVSAERPLFYLVNGLGAVLILTGAAHQFDIGDLGTVGQELIWAIISLLGGLRAWRRQKEAGT